MLYYQKICGPYSIRVLAEANIRLYRLPTTSRSSERVFAKYLRTANIKPSIRSYYSEKNIPYSDVWQTGGLCGVRESGESGLYARGQLFRVRRFASSRLRCSKHVLFKMNHVRNNCFLFKTFLKTFFLLTIFSGFLNF